MCRSRKRRRLSVLIHAVFHIVPYCTFGSTFVWGVGDCEECDVHDDGSPPTLNRPVFWSPAVRWAGFPVGRPCCLRWASGQTGMGAGAVTPPSAPPPPQSSFPPWTPGAACSNAAPPCRPYLVPHAFISFNSLNKFWFIFREISYGMSGKRCRLFEELPLEGTRGSVSPREDRSNVSGQRRTYLRESNKPHYESKSINRYDSIMKAHFKIRALPEKMSPFNNRSMAL